MTDFGETTKQLARNPLGVVALFLVLVYAIAGLLVKFSGDILSTGQKWPLVWFLVVFPVLVLGVFYWLVTKHTTKLYAPSDFKSEESYFRSLSITPEPPRELGTALLPPAEVIEGKMFGAEEIAVDGKRYRKCSFKGSTLVFRGLRPVEFSNSTFMGVTFRLDGPAALTINFLTALYHSGEGGRELVNGVLARLRGNSTEQPR
jgi:hypothetical protein